MNVVSPYSTNVVLNERRSVILIATTLSSNTKIKGFDIRGK